ncbi:MAG TPA: DUF4105 domain-containing protein [Candidatus Binatia bacterium]|nr:DUF4105 domain-containing protein [Candidatus Binatia bacterium]
MTLAVPIGLAGAGAVGWAGLALWFDGPRWRLLAGALAVGFVVVALGAPLVLRPRRRGVAALVVLWLVVLGWWMRIPPRADRDWQPDVARLPSAEIRGDLLTVHNVRDFAYRSEADFRQRWETRTYDLSQIRGVDLFLCFWGPTLVAHTIMSWEFTDGQHLAVSIETRKERGEEYSALRGFFRQYELYYVVADERDVVRLRTNHRGERVFLYRLRGSPALARALLVAYLEEVNRLAAQPQWYNAFTRNCTTSIRLHVWEAGIRNTLDWRVLANGRGDAMLYERGDIDTSLPFAEVRARSDITARARATAADVRFSDRIRENLPPRPAPPPP